MGDMGGIEGGPEGGDRLDLVQLCGSFEDSRAAQRMADHQRRRHAPTFQIAAAGNQIIHVGGEGGIGELPL